MDLNDKTILVTGGTGSFGKCFIATVLKRFNPKRLIILSRDEFKQYEMQQSLDHPSLRFFVGDVRDKDRLRRAFRGVDYLIHAAALKQVPAAEYNPFEFVKTNILGAQNIIDVAIDLEIEKVIALSTDKASNPINLYGATKLCSDKLFIAGNSYAGKRDTRFSVVRYGNVAGSRGSVIPFFEKLKKSGTLPITDERMTRFWLSLSESVELVLMALEKMQGGEIFVPKIPTASIPDLATAIAPECKQEIVGIRPGEKLHETLISEEEGRMTLDCGDYYVIQPNFPWWGKLHKGKGCTPVEDGFFYSSDMNSWRLSVDELREMLREI